MARLIERPAGFLSNAFGHLQLSIIWKDQNALPDRVQFVQDRNSSAEIHRNS